MREAKFKFREMVAIKSPFYENLYGYVEHHYPRWFGLLQPKYHVFVYRDKECLSYMMEYEKFKESDLVELPGKPRRPDR